MEVLAPISFRLTPMEFCDVPFIWPGAETDKFILELNNKLTKNGIIAMNYLISTNSIRLKNTNIPISLFTRQTSVFGDNWTVTINKDDKIGVLHKLS
jgi:hypothetical protein